MRYLAVLFVCLSIGCASSGPSAPSVDSTSGSIFGGRLVELDEIYGTVSLLQVPNWQAAFCTGTLIAPRVVLTAAHCVTFERNGNLRTLGPSDLVIGHNYRTGAEFRSADVGRVQEVIVHESYNNFQTFPPNDIAILILTEPLTSMQVVPVLEPSDARAALSAGDTVILSGYGQRENGQSGSLYITETTVQQRSQTQILTEARTGQGAACFGDSGGPLYTRLGETLFVAGAASTLSSSECGDGTIHTLASAYLEWIRARAGDLIDGGETTPDRGVGNACSDDADCFTDNCLTEAETGLPGGYCSDECSATADCGGDAVCLEVGDGMSICIDGCVEDGCREGYRCQDADGSPSTPDSICWFAPACVASGDCDSVGDPCTGPETCELGYCFDEESSGFPSGYCSGVGCVDDSDCGSDGSCIVIGRGNVTACFTSCDDDSDCRDAYVCDDLDGDSTTTGPGVCFPGCTSNAECHDGLVCDEGFCSPPRGNGGIGAACESTTDCAAGFCAPEDTFPGGYCVVFGCESDADCGGDALCIAVDENGNQACFDGCVDAADCRDGYACADLDGSRASSNDRICFFACAGDAECGDNELCEDEVCVRDPNAPEPGDDAGTAFPDGGGPVLPDGGAVDPGSNLNPSGKSGCSASRGPVDHRGLWLMLVVGALALRRRR